MNALTICATILGGLSLVGSVIVLVLARREYSRRRRRRFYLYADPTNVTTRHGSGSSELCPVFRKSVFQVGARAVEARRAFGQPSGKFEGAIKGQAKEAQAGNTSANMDGRRNHSRLERN